MPLWLHTQLVLYPLLLLRDLPLLPSPQVRRQLASNPSLSEHLLRSLFNDSDRKVVFAAEENFAQRIRKQQREQTQTDASQPEPKPEQTTSKAERPRKGALFNKIANFFND